MTGRHAETPEGSLLPPPVQELAKGSAPRPYIPQRQRLAYLIHLHNQFAAMAVRTALDWIDGYAVLTVTPAGPGGPQVTVGCVYHQGAWWFCEVRTRKPIGPANELARAAHMIRAQFAMNSVIVA
jgi:hypothetical protein